MNNMVSYQKIILPTRPQPDTIAAIFLLKTFGRTTFPDIAKANVEILTDLPSGKTEEDFANEGTILIDIGKGKFDHHAQGKTASHLVAEYLGIAESLSIAKLLSYTQRDDQYGMGTISQDPLDKAFGLSGLIAVLNRSLPQNPNEIVGFIIPLLSAHVFEEKKRTEDLPKEYKEKLVDGRAKEIELRHKKTKIKMVVIESDDPSMVGFLRSAQGSKADVVIQKIQAGHINIMTRPLKKIDLRQVATLIRREEATVRSRNIQAPDSLFATPGRIKEVPEWYYDRATNSLLNGGAAAKGVGATKLSLETITGLAKEGLERS